MFKRKCLVFLAATLWLSISVTQSRKSFAEEPKLTAEEVVAKHLQSIGSPEALKEIKSRVFYGASAVKFIQGFQGNYSNGDLVFASEKSKLGIILKYKDVNYPGEYFAYDGNEVSVGYIKPGQRSPLADFIFRFNGLVKEGLLGGVLSVNWPLLDIQKNQPTLKYELETVEDRKVHALEYRSKKGLGDMKVKLFFDYATFRHVRTEYTVRVKDDMSTLPDGSARGRTIGGNNLILPSGASGVPFDRGTRGAVGSDIRDQIPDSIYKLVENFGSFADVGGLMLPHVYTYDYSLEGQGSSFIAQWTMKAGSYFTHNAQIGPEFFRAQK